MRLVTKSAVARYVVDCLRREDVPRVSELAEQSGMTAEHLSRVFRAHFHVRISDYMKTIQVRYARHLLATTHLNTTRIAYLAGFGTRRTFFRTYRRMTGHSPAEDIRLSEFPPGRRFPRNP